MNERQKKYKQQNKLYLEQKAKEDGVVELSSGVLCRKLKQGSGSVCAKPNSIVFVHYTGRLIDGTVIDSTEDGTSLPACFVVNQLIMGWQIALTRMREGDRWEIYIPYEYGYGNKRVDDIPAFSTLVFELELVKMERR